MWRRIYLLLLAVRIYFALSPSYLHPDEVFQGPEVIAGELFGYQNVRTWEWTVANPIRSVFPLWPVYGIPMALLKAVWARDGDGTVSPVAIYYTTRLVMFVLSFVLEDWAIHELVPSPRRRTEAVILVTSCYVTWTFQTHTFSNSVETVLVLWCLVLMQRVASVSAPQTDEKGRLTTDAVLRRSYITSSLLLGFLLVFGLFNRITFPAFLLIPGMQLLPTLWNRPLALIALVISSLFWISVAIATDTAFYTGSSATTSFRALFETVHNNPIITPINNLLYNTKASNLKAHGLHPHYQHLLVNLPQLLGPALVLLVPLPPRLSDFNVDRMLSNTRLTAAVTGSVILSVIPHQEPRFLLPCIPLILTCVSVPESPIWHRRFWIVWALFNSIMALLMGVYHQGGVTSIQLAMPNTIRTSLSNAQSSAKTVEVHWWKTYPPSLYMLGPPITNPLTNETITITTNPLLGANRSTLYNTISANLPPCSDAKDSGLFGRLTNAVAGKSGDSQVLLVAPFSAWRFSPNEAIPSISNFSFTLPAPSTDDDNVLALQRKKEKEHDLPPLPLTHLETYRHHLNLDDMDFGDDGILPTLQRVVGRRGLGVWRVERDCSVASDG